jgi:vacuolar-type H+-ATPase subunit I/STV1
MVTSNKLRLNVRELNKRIAHLNRRLAKGETLEKSRRSNFRSIESMSRSQHEEAIRRINSLETQLAAYEDEVNELKGEITELNKLKGEITELNKSKKLEIETKVGGRYSDPIRESVYLCARRQVPIHSISSVVGEISKLLFNCELSPLPCASTIGTMIAE